jgi:hypothetical protein
MALLLMGGGAVVVSLGLIDDALRGEGLKLRSTKSSGCGGYVR